MKRSVIRAAIKVLIGFAVGWIVCMVEYVFCATAYGGPFTVLMLPVMAFILSGIFVTAAFLIGLILRFPGVRDLWGRLGRWSLLLTGIGLGIMICASGLRLRSVDPVSGYKIMSPWVWSICFFLVVFPIVNFPAKRQPHV